MRTLVRILQKGTAVVLAAAMMLTMLPAAAYAQEETLPEETAVTVEQAEEEAAGETEAEAAEAADAPEEIPQETDADADTEETEAGLLSGEEEDGGLILTDSDEEVYVQEELPAPEEETEAGLLSATEEYSGLIPTDSDDAETLAAKQVSFGGYQWYVIEDNSTSATEGTLTLLAVDCIGTSYFTIRSKTEENTKNEYSATLIKRLLDDMTGQDGLLSGVANAIKTVRIETKGYESDDIYDTADNVKCYLLDAEEAANLPENIRKIATDWWLRSPGDRRISALSLNCESGSPSITEVNTVLGVRPALQLDLSAVVFRPESKKFFPASGYSVTLTGGNNATASGSTSQTGLFDEKMETVTYTADNGYFFENFADVTDHGITMRRTGMTTVTVSGTPTGNVSITVPDAIETTTFTQLIPTGSEDGDALAAKQVVFGGYRWYIIGDDSTSATEGSLTLFAAECIGDATCFDDYYFRYFGNLYSTSLAKEAVDALTARGGVLSDVADAIKTISVETILDVGSGNSYLYEKSDDIKCYLLSNAEAAALPENVRKCSPASKATGNRWWLRTPSYSRERVGLAAYVENVRGDDGCIEEYDDIDLTGAELYGIRPAMQIDLSLVAFDSDTNTFSVNTFSPINRFSVTLTGGDHAVASGGSTVQSGLTGAMDTVTYTADEGYAFPQESEYYKVTSGVTVERPYATKVTVSGTPTDDVDITVPDAVAAPLYTALIPTGREDAKALSAKQVTFGGYQWYVIEDQSTSATEGTVTLLAADGFKSDHYDIRGDRGSKRYSESGIKPSIDRLTTEDGELFAVADAIKTVDVTTKSYHSDEIFDTAYNVKCYILDAEEAANLPENIRKINADWWLRSPVGNITYDKIRVNFVNDSGKVSKKPMNEVAFVRPALQLDLSMVSFSSKTNTFSMPLELHEKTGQKHEVCNTKILYVGNSFSLIPVFADNAVSNKRVVWTSSDPGVATVTQDGKVTGHYYGKVIISARSEENPDLKADCFVRILNPVKLIMLSRNSWSFGSGESVSLSAILPPEYYQIDNFSQQQIVWSTSDASVVTVCDMDTGFELSGKPSGKGKVYDAGKDDNVMIVAGSAGKAKVTATALYGNGAKAVCNFTVGNPLPAADAPDFTVTGKGNAMDLAAGKTLAMNVNWPGNKKPANAEVTWSVIKADGETKNASEIATITQKGVLTGLSEGKVKVVATSAANPEVKKESAEITVYVPVKSAALNVTSGTVSLADGANGLQLQALVTSAVAGQKATGTVPGDENKGQPTVSWEVDPKYENTLLVSASGLVTAKAGAATANNIPVTGTVKAYNYEKKLTCKVSVKAQNPLKGIKISSKKLSIGKGNTAVLTATLNPVNPDGNAGYTWKSLNEDIATVDADGTVTALNPGTATITVTASEKIVSAGKETNPSATCTVTVTPSVTEVVLKNVSATNRLAVGKTLPVKTEFRSSDDRKKASTTLIWTSSDNAVATVTQKGVVKAVSPGTATITAQSADTKAEGDAPSASFVVNTFVPVKSITFNKTKLTLGTREGLQEGIVSVSAFLPENAVPSIEWTADNRKVMLGITESFEYYEPGESAVSKDGHIKLKALEPGTVKLTGVTTDGSNKKVTVTVTIRGEATGLSLKTFTTKNGLGQVEDKGEEEGTKKYGSTLKAGGKLSLTPLVDINGISGATTDSAEEKVYAEYKKTTDVSVSYRSSKTSVATVDKNGKITVNRNAQNGDTATIYVMTADGRHKAELGITVTK